MAAPQLPDTRISPTPPALQHWPTREPHVTEAAAGSLGSRRACSHRAGHVEPEARALLPLPARPGPLAFNRGCARCRLTLHSLAGEDSQQCGHTRAACSRVCTDTKVGTQTRERIVPLTQESGQIYYRAHTSPARAFTTIQGSDVGRQTPDSTLTWDFLHYPIIGSARQLETLALPACRASHLAQPSGCSGISPPSWAQRTVPPSPWTCQPFRGAMDVIQCTRKALGEMELISAAAAAAQQTSPACLAKMGSPALEKSSAMPGMDFSHMYQMYKPRRGLKRSEDCKDTYKLPHRLIEKKRRDRINECIAQLKDLLPEHLKLTTLGHLEKAVVLELTLKHVKALTNLIDQQQQRIISLQSNGAQAGDLPPTNPDSTQEIFRSGFQVCAKEVLQYLAEQESEGSDVESSQLVGHLQRVAADVLCGGSSSKAPESAPSAPEKKEKPSSLARASEGHGKNCVPVIQRTFAPLSSEQSGSDTDTDSGYGGELEKLETTPTQQYYQKDSSLTYHVQERVNNIKKETEDVPAKRARMEMSDEEGSPFNSSNLASHGFLGPHQHPQWLPFYLLPSSTTAYLPMLDKCWYPGSMPLLYPGLSASTTALSGLMSPDKGPSSTLMPQRLPSPGSALSPLDSSDLMQALKQIPPLSMEAKD